MFGVVYAIWQVMTAYHNTHGRVLTLLLRWMTWPPFAHRLKAGNVLLKNSTDAHPLLTILRKTTTSVSFCQTPDELLLTAIQLRSINSTRSSLKQLVHHRTRLRRSLRTQHLSLLQKRRVQRILLLSSFRNRVLFKLLHL